MRATRRYGSSLVVLVSLLVGGIATRAGAVANSDRGASIVLFAKVVANLSEDTVIQITNTTNRVANAHCFYVKGLGTCSATASPCLHDADCSAAPQPQTCIDRWQTIDFNILVTAQQPTVWRVSTGRPTNPADSLTGLDPGNVPALSTPFAGELKCIETDVSGLPISGNSLIGLATIKNVNLQDLASYNAVGLRGFDTNDGDDVLCLGGGPSATCPNGAEYEGCPEQLILNHEADGATDQVVGPGSVVTTAITLVPCSQDFEAQTPATAAVIFRAVNEFEDVFSASTTFTCWDNLALGSISPIFTVGSLLTDFAQTRISAVANGPGVIAVAQEFHQIGGPISLSASAAFNLHTDGTRTGSDLIVLPPVPPGP